MFKKFSLVLFGLGVITSANATDLMDVYQQVLAADPRVRLAEINIQIGADRESQVMADLLPQLSVSSSISTVRQDLEGNNPAISRRSDRDSFKGERYSAVLSQSLFDLPKFYNWQRQQKMTNQFSHDQLEIQQQIMLDVVLRYFEVLSAQDNLTVAENEKVVTQGILKQLKRQYEKQLVKITDLMAAQARSDFANAQMIEAQTTLIIAKEQLTELTGSPVKALKPLWKGFEFQPVEADVKKWLALLTANNPKLLSKNDAIAAEKLGIKQQRSGHLPVVDFQLMVQRTDMGFNSSTIGLTNITSASVNVNMPLFSGGKTSALHSEAIHKLEASKLEYETEFRKLRRELIGYLTGINASVEKIKAAKTALNSANKNYKSMDKGFKYGVVDASDLFEAQSFVSKANRDLFDSKYQYISNKTNLMYIGGMITHQELELINLWLEQK